MSSPPSTVAVETLLGLLRDNFPSGLSIDVPHISLASINEGSAGLGRFRGNREVGAFGSVALKAVRLKGTVRYEITGDREVVNQAEDALRIALTGMRDLLLKEGLLRFHHEQSDAAQFLGSMAGWRKQMLYGVLFEYSYVDSADAGSLVVRIPYTTDMESPNALEEGAATGNLVLWRQLSDPLWEQTPNLTIRGPKNLTRIACSVSSEEKADPEEGENPLTSGGLPTGSVCIRYTPSLAVDPVEKIGFEQFLDALTAPVGPNGPVELCFEGLEAFLSSLEHEPPAIAFPDFEVPDQTKNFHSFALNFPDKPIRLRHAGDRLDIFYGREGPRDPPVNLDRPAVIYLRVS